MSDREDLPAPLTFPSGKRRGDGFNWLTGSPADYYRDTIMSPDYAHIAPYMTKAFRWLYPALLLGGVSYHRALYYVDRPGIVSRAVLPLHNWDSLDQTALRSQVQITAGPETMGLSYEQEQIDHDIFKRWTVIYNTNVQKPDEVASFAEGVLLHEASLDLRAASV